MGNSPAAGREYHRPANVHRTGPTYSHSQLEFLASLPPDEPFRSIEDFKEQLVLQDMANDMKHAAQIVRFIELTPEEAQCPAH